MIPYSELESIMLASLDAEGSDRYIPELDIVPAINGSIRRATTAIGWALANRKGSEEALRELTRLRVFQTNTEGGVNLDDPLLGHGVWNVLGVYAEPEIVGDGTILNIPPAESRYRADISFSGTGKRVRRITLEQVPNTRGNMFMPGNEVLANNAKLREYAYYIIGDASSSAYSSGGNELRIIPKSVTGKVLVAISYLKNPDELTTAGYQTESIEFPQMMKQTLAAWALDYIAYKQGDTATLKVNAMQDAQALFGFTTN